MAIKKVIVTGTDTKVVTMGTQGLPVNLSQFSPDNLLGIKQVGGENVLTGFNQADIRALLQTSKTSVEWAAANPILGDGEIGFENDTKKIKIGDGLTSYNNLLYYDSRPYKVFTARLTQDGTVNPPVVIIFENTIGNIVWTRYNAGRYRAELTNAFPPDKTFVNLYNGNAPSVIDTPVDVNNSDPKIWTGIVNLNYVEIRTGYFSVIDLAPHYIDGLGPFGIFIEIRVYP